MENKVIKNEALAYIAAASLAFALFEGFENFLVFCEWLQPLIYAWRFLIYNLFDLLFFWIPFTIPRAIIDIFVVALLAGALILRAAFLWENRRNAETFSGVIVLDNQGLLLKLYPFCVIIVGGFFLLPVFGETPQSLLGPLGGSNLQDLLYPLPLMARFFVFAACSAMALFIRAKLEEGLFMEAAVSRQLLRVVTILALLLTVNFLGLYADKLRGIDIDHLTQDVDMSSAKGQ